MTNHPDAWTSDQAYEPYVGRWSRLVAPRFLRWLPSAPPAASWCDVGCGIGRSSATADRRVAKRGLAVQREHLALLPCRDTVGRCWCGHGLPDVIKDFRHPHDHVGPVPVLVPAHRCVAAGQLPLMRAPT